MKNYLFLLIFSFSASLLMAQGIEASPELVTEFEQGYFAADERVGRSEVTNTDSIAKSFNWLIEDICNEADIEVFLSNNNAGYFVGMVEGVMTMEAGEVGYVDLHFYTAGLVYPLTSSVTLTEVDNESNTVTIIYEYGDCGIMLGADEIEAAKMITLYPNPVKAAFMLSENTVVENVVVYNILGSVIRRFNASASGTYDIADLSIGIYMVQLLGEDDELLRTMKMNKL